jgi:predicted glycogen debranching enzyme
LSIQFPKLSFEKSPFDEALRSEWLLTNGIGGYASSTALGLNTRKYHALLVAALRPPGERTVVLSKIDEDIKVGDQTWQLGANDFQGSTYPEGYKYLTKFTLDPYPTYTYEAEQFHLSKKIVMPLDQNAVIAYYTVENRSDSELTVAAYPLVTYRHYHYVIANPLWLHQTKMDTSVELEFNNPATTTVLKAVGDGAFIEQPRWVTGVYYREEANRGESAIDQSYEPGYFEFKVMAGSKKAFAVAATIAGSHEGAERTLNTYGASVPEIEVYLSNELEKRRTILSSFYSSSNVAADDNLSWLLLSANDFIAKGTATQRFIIAGYQWFGSWGRDSFVSLPGLMLTTGRFSEAKSVLLDFADYIKAGLVPNLIDDKTGEPMYNTVDGTLWYINAVLQYLKYTNDQNFAKQIWPDLNDVIINHRDGTLNEIHVDSDGLLSHGPQLTWMDTVVDDAPFTPRAGKAVEVQALWYNALKTMEVLGNRFMERRIATEYAEMAEKAKNSFNRLFWDEKQGCLFDVIDPAGNPDPSIRPNQAIVGALDYQLLDKEKMRSAVNFVHQELLTPAGLRTLSPSDPRYKGKYEGTRPDRDRAYHNGSIWPWLSGPFTTAYLKANGYSQTNIEYAYENFIKSLLDFGLPRGGLGTLNEINDGDPPFTPRGCIAQAWSVAEPLRAYVEDILLIRPRYEKEVLNPPLTVTSP